jgi:hypothetical protein
VSVDTDERAHGGRVTARDVARALGADAATLRAYARRTDPTAPQVLGRFLGDPAHRDAVERWFAARDDGRRSG